MKNYSSLSIGENDDLRQIYERSASQASGGARSARDHNNNCRSELLMSRNNNNTANQSTIESNKKEVINPINHKVSSMYTSPRKLLDKITGKNTNNNNYISKEQKTSFFIGTAATSDTILANSKIGHEETKIVWPSKDQPRKHKTGGI